MQKWDKQKLPDPTRVRQTLKSKVYSDLSVTDKKTLLSYLAARKFEQEKYVLFEESEIQRYIAEYLDISTEESQEVLKAIEAHHGLLIKRAQGIWSFSHLTFQEYFAAKWFCDRADWEGLVSHITDSYWREVFLLAVGMVESADNLLQLIKTSIDTSIEWEQKLQYFLTYLYQKSFEYHHFDKPAAIRSYYFTVILNFLCDYNLSVEVSLPKSFGDFYSWDYPAGVNFDTFLCWNYSRAYNLTFRFSTISSFPGGSYLMDFLYDIDDIDNNYLYSNFNFEPLLKQSIKKLKQQLPNSKNKDEELELWWKSNGKRWTDKLKYMMIEYRNLKHDWQFSDTQRELLQQYYDSNKLLMDFLNSGCEVSDDVREYIEETLLLPVTEIKKRYQQIWITDLVND